jgi:hypothetical protein
MAITTGATYDGLMPVLDGAILAEEFENPAEGKARLTLRDTNEKRVWTFEFVEGEGREGWWRKRGIPPVVWHYVPPTRDRPPQVWIAVDRLTKINETPDNGQWCWFWAKKRPSDLPNMPAVSMANENPSSCGCHTSHHKRPREQFRTFDDPELQKFRTHDRVSLKPEVTIFRVQNSSLMPDPLDPTTIMSCIGEPHIILPGGNAEAIDKGEYEGSGELNLEKLTAKRSRGEIATGILVMPQPQGVVFQALNDWFYLTVELKNKNRPGSFAYQVFTGGATKAFLFDHDKNVKITVTTVKAPSTKPIFVYARQRWGPEDVPEQGAPIRFERSKFASVDVPDNANTSLLLATQMVVETLMGFVPVIGDLYQFGQVAFMCATGKDFWGNKVSSAEIVLYGVLALVGSGAPALVRRSAKLNALKRAESIVGAMEAPNGLAMATMRQADAVVLQVGGNRTAREIAVLGQAQREKVLEPVLDAVAAGGDVVKTSEKAADLLKQGLAAAIQADKKVAEAIDDIRAASMLTGDGANFQNQYLRFEYDKYLAKAGSKKQGPLEWLASGSRNPWVDRYCRTLFGKDYKEAIRGSLKRTGVPGSMTMKHIELYDKLIGKGIGNYGNMGREARKVPGFGQFFELDHIIEQRFLKRFTAYTDAYAKGQAFGTFLVPKNAAVAAEMVKVAKDSKLITYVHVVKTRMLSQRIPFGAEHLFNVQQIADATLYTLHKLGAGAYLDVAFLKTDFELLALAMKQTAPTLKTAAELTDDLFTAAKGWPQVQCDNWGRAIL